MLCCRWCGVDERRDANRPALCGGREKTGSEWTQEAAAARRKRFEILKTILEVPALHDSQRSWGHRCILGREAAPEVGALDQRVSFICYQSPDRNSKLWAACLNFKKKSVGWTFLYCSFFLPRLQRGAEAVRLPIGQSHHWDSLLSQQRLRHCGVSTCRLKKITLDIN